METVDQILKVLKANGFDVIEEGVGDKGRMVFGKICTNSGSQVAFTLTMEVR